jgi:TolA-binding protein
MRNFNFLAVWLGFALLPGIAFGEDTTPQATIEIPVAPSSLPTDQAEIPAIQIPDAPVNDCPQPALPPETTASKLRTVQQSLTSQKLELFRSTTKNTTTTKNLFSRLISSAANPIDGDLLSEMRRFTERFPDSPESAEVLHLMAQVHKRADNPTSAAIDWLVLRSAYPDSPLTKEASKQLQALAGDELKKHSVTLKLWLAQTEKLEGEREERLANMLKYLGGNTEKDFAAALTDACASFLVSNQNWLQEDVIEHAYARQATLLDAQVALFHFEKMLALYPSSPLIPDSMLSIGNVQRKFQKAFEPAAKSYAKLIEKFPDSNETKQAYEALAAMYDEDMRDYPNALKTYDTIVARYKDDPIVLRALLAMASIQQNKSNQPAQAITSHLKIADIFKTPEGLEALLAAARIANFTTRDWKVAIDINSRIMAFSPQHEEAIKAQFNTADITESKLNDKESAKKQYEEFVAKHPGHSLSKDANRRIESINKALISAAQQSTTPK